MATRIDRRDLPWVALIAVSFVLALAVSWERWGNPLVDCGREMNQPLRLVRGEMLYSEVRHIYGPLSPYLNAGLYQLFGPSLWLLYLNGIISAAIILAVIYWLARQLMDRAASGAAALSVMWLCAFKQAGNYILPYSYSALHGCALGLLALFALVRFIQGSTADERLDNAGASDVTGRASNLPGGRSRNRVFVYLLGAGFFSGLALLAKTEMGLAAVAAGITTAVLVGHPGVRPVLRNLAVFTVPAFLPVVVVYSAIAGRTGWDTLAGDSFLFLQNLPPELVYFNQRISGLFDPRESIMQMCAAILKILGIALAIGTISHFLSLPRESEVGVEMGLQKDPVTDAGRMSYGLLFLLLVFSVLIFAALPVLGRMRWDTGPYLAMPVILVAFLAVSLVRYQRKLTATGTRSFETVTLIVIAVFSLVSIARMILRVRSGGAYSSYLLPTSVILFTYGWVSVFPTVLGNLNARRLARNIAVSLILLDVTATAGLIGHRYRDKNTYPIETNRGTLIALPDLGESFAQALEYIDREVPPGAPVAVMPEGTSLNFFSDRPNPLREEITTPGYLHPEAEERAISQLETSGTRVVLITNRATSEFGAAVFGRDYCIRLMRWIHENYDQVAVFGPDKDPGLEIGHPKFFIKAYLKKQPGN